MKKDTINTLNKSLNDIKPDSSDNFMDTTKRVKGQIMGEFGTKAEECHVKGSTWDVKLVIDDIES